VAIPNIKTFRDDDNGYQTWVQRHGGYVLTQRSKGAYMLHHWECTHLGKDKSYRSITRKPRRCGDRRALVAWTQRSTGHQPQHCQTCL